MKKILYTLTVLVMSFSASAHPHIWVYTDLGINTKNDEITSIEVQWKFDEMYSSAFMMDADTNGNKKLDADEALAMEKQVLEKAVTMLTPFVMLKLQNIDVHNYNFKDLKISYDEKSEQVVYNFKIKLNKPIKLKGFHKLAIVDENFYVAFEQSYNFNIPKNCSFDLIEDEEIFIYEGMVNPEVYQLTCK